MNNKYSIAVLLPTRGRTDALDRSVMELVNLSKHPDQIQFILAFDDDDSIGPKHFESSLKAWLDDRNIAYLALSFDPAGYEKLYLYYNTMATHASADWLFVWNDDAIMQTQDWDQIIIDHTGEFKLLAVRTHNDHPYSIFPIVPIEWLNQLGYLCRHQMIDAELSHAAYVLDIFKRVDIHVIHDRADLTGNNADATDKKRVRFEGNPSDPRDFHHRTLAHQRSIDYAKLETYMQSKGLDTSWYKNVVNGVQDPWEKLKINDINKQCVQTTFPK